MEQCKCHHSFQGCEVLKPTAININFVLKNINKLDFSPLWELFMVLYQNKEARKKSKNCYTGFASCIVQNASFLCARMQFKGKFWQSIMVVELTHMAQQAHSFSLVLLKFWSSLGKGKKWETRQKQQLDWRRQLTVKASWSFCACVNDALESVSVIHYASCKLLPRILPFLWNLANVFPW